MRLTSLFKCLLSFFLLAVASNVQAQQVQIVLGPDEIGENQAWTITITVQNGELKKYDNFPEIVGFRKRGTSNQSSTSIINGQASFTQSIIMTYLPTKQGTFTIPDFTLRVNDKPIRVAGKKVKVGAPVQRQQSDPFRDFFNSSPDDFFGRGETEFVDVKEDAFLALTTNKDEIYAGEGVNVTLSFYVASGNRAPLQFYELQRQLAEIVKKIRPVNCWEENFNIENIEAESVTISGKDYNQYKIYQATLFPLNAEEIVFPSVGLEMIKFKVAKNPSFFGQNRQEDFKTFYSKQKKVKVKELPPHPLRDVVAVGDYHLDEGLRSTDLETGKSTPYQFNIYGEGNIAGIEKPGVKNSGIFEFYEPNVRQDITRANNRITGTKSFNYFIIPKEPGQYKLGDYFHWVFFNPNKKKYDTLRSTLTVYVKGESKKNEVIESNDPGSFYDKLNTTDNTIRNIADNRWQKWVFNSFIVLMLGASVYFLVKK
jgi:hypothetical protein